MPDRTGARLILTSDLARPQTLTVAICAGGQRVSIKFETRQPARAGGSGRQSPDQFDMLAGTVFGVVGAPVDRCASCLIVPDSLLAGRQVLKVSKTGAREACAAEGRIAQLRDRAVTRCWPLAVAGMTARILLVEFERRGKDALASVVLIDGSRTIFADYAAEFRGEGESLWRVDDEGNLRPDGFDIVGVLQRGAWYALATSWRGAEGQSRQLWVSDGSDRFTTVLADYLYQAPN